MVDSSFIGNVERADTTSLCGKTGRIRGFELFPINAAPYWQSIRLAPQPSQELDPLYQEMAALIAEPDALDPESDTARRLAELDARVTELETREAEAFSAAFDEQLLAPLHEGIELARELRKTLSSHDNSAPDDTAATDTAQTATSA